MHQCRFCNSKSLVKNGVIRCNQRYKCKLCKKNQLVTDGRIKYSNKDKAMAVAMYLNNVGFRAIGRIMNIPFQLIHCWIKKAGALVEKEAEALNKAPKKIEILEMDELYTYIKKKNGKHEYGLLLIGTEMKLLHII